MSNNPIIFNLGEETRPVVETNLADSMFAELYQKAFVEIENYLNSVKKVEGGGNNSNLDQIAANEEVNNIFAFIGERGAGKTSCMLTVANALHLNTKKKEDLLDKLKSNSSADEDLYKLIYKTPFEVLDIIDPSFFDNKNNILSLIIAKLFKNFKKKASDANCKHDEQNRRNLIELFEQVQKNLSVLFSKEDHIQIDSLESLSKLSAAVDLKDDIYKLVDSYLKFVISDRDTNSKLVVMIDDIDLHTQHARDMVEQVRKYFIQSNVLILMSVKIDQLDNVLKNHLTDEYSALIKCNHVNIDLIEQMSERYIGKLIPHNRRFFLPEVSICFDRALEINTTTGSRNFTSISKAVLSLIYEKTRYLFFDNQDTSSYIIPSNLRELRHLIALLVGMEKYHDSSSKFSNNSKVELSPIREKVREYNKILFRKYFTDTWCNNNLDNKGKGIIDSFFQIKDAELINKSVLHALIGYFEDHLSIFSVHNIKDESISNGCSRQYQEQISSILNDSNVNYNISLGDVLAVVDYLSLRVFSILNKRFLFAVKFFYSIRLYEYYGEIENESNVLICKNEIQEYTSSIKNYSNYTRLTGGSLINSIALEENIKGLNLHRKYNNIMVQRINTSKFYDQLKEKDVLSVILSLIAVTTDLDNIKFRENSYCRFDNPFVIRNKEVADGIFIDLSSVFFNMLNIDDAYNRFQITNIQSIIPILNRIPLFKRVLFSNFERGSYSSYNLLNDIRSQVAIRNIEVLDKVKEHIANVISSILIEDINSPKEILLRFFDNLSSLEINLDKDDSRHKCFNWRVLKIFSLSMRLKQSSVDKSQEEVYKDSYISSLFQTETYIKDKQSEYNGLQNKLVDLKQEIKFLENRKERLIGTSEYEKYIKEKKNQLGKINDKIKEKNKTIELVQKTIDLQLIQLMTASQNSGDNKNQDIVDKQRETYSKTLDSLRKEKQIIELEFDEIRKSLMIDQKSFREEQRVLRQIDNRIKDAKQEVENVEKKIYELDIEAELSGISFL